MRKHAALLYILNFIIRPGVVLVCMSWAQVYAESGSRDVGLEPPGHLFDIGGYNLHLYCQGSGNPAVIIDSGAGGFSLEWKNIQQTLAAEICVCTYDRAGYGWSDIGPMPRTTRRIATELRLLLTKAGIPPPYVFIGHSFGGYTAQYYARNFSDEVIGLVLVDSSHPEQNDRFNEISDYYSNISENSINSYKIIQPVVPENYPQEYTEIARQFMSSWKSVMTIREEMFSLPTSGQQILSSKPMPDIPVIVLARSNRIWPLTEEGDAKEQMWRQLQSDLAGFSRNTIYQVVENSGHHIHLDQPAILIGVIRELFESIKYGIPLDRVHCGENTAGTVATETYPGC